MYRQRLFPITLWTAQDLDNAGTLESAVIQGFTRDPDIFMFRVTNAAQAADVKIEICISNDGTNFNSYDSQEPIVESTNTEFASRNPEEFHALTLPSAPWFKIKVTELGTHDDNVVDATIWMREEA
jgi:hypothetical protein